MRKSEFVVRSPTSQRSFGTTRCKMVCKAATDRCLQLAMVISVLFYHQVSATGLRGVSIANVPTTTSLPDMKVRVIGFYCVRVIVCVLLCACHWILVQIYIIRNCCPFRSQCFLREIFRCHCDQAVRVFNPPHYQYQGNRCRLAPRANKHYLTMLQSFRGAILLQQPKRFPRCIFRERSHQTYRPNGTR